MGVYSAFGGAQWLLPKLEKATAQAEKQGYRVDGFTYKSPGGEPLHIEVLCDARRRNLIYVGPNGGISTIHQPEDCK